MKTPTKVDALEVKVFGGHEEMARAAAEEAAECLRKALASQSGATAILASAASQIIFLEHLVAAAGIQWSRVTLFHMDEYLGIAEDHPASFRRFLRERVELRVRPKAFHYVRGEADQPIGECDRYDALLRAQPIDLCCLGIGENGHIAFNDPPVADFEDRRWVKLVKLDEACRRQQVGEGAFADLEAVPKYAYTLTVPALCGARRMICVVPERRKAAAVRNALTGPISPSCPASMLRRQAQAVLYLDADSASEWAGSLSGS
jgi:glucosamine-6-phosphate deaminase